MFSLRSPLHVGAGQVGNVQRTRPYVTGKTLWGALTARLTRDIHPGATTADYRRIGNQVDEQLPFSYFYPAVGEQVEPWPWGEKADEFSGRYLNTYAATALDYTRNAAEDGSLHEVEYIAPTTREGQAVNLIGYIFEQQGCQLPWKEKETLNRLQLGGERTYGWGRVKLESDPLPTNDVFGYRLELKEKRPIVIVPANAVLRAHTLVADFDNGDVIQRAVRSIQGQIEPLVGRETVSQDRFGIHHSTARICYVPGSQVKTELKVQVGTYGIWEAIDDI
jgi:hypothetical protein